MIHFQTVYDEAGMPVRLEWCPEIQRAGEVHAKEVVARRRKMMVAAARPMPHLEQWAIRHGLWTPDGANKA